MEISRSSALDRIYDVYGFQHGTANEMLEWLEREARKPEKNGHAKSKAVVVRFVGTSDSDIPRPQFTYWMHYRCIAEFWHFWHLPYLPGLGWATISKP